MDTYLNEVMRYLVAQSWQIAVLTAVVATIAFALRRRSAHIRYLLWLLVVAKCLVPPLHVVPVRILPQAMPRAVPSLLPPLMPGGERPLLPGPAAVDTHTSPRPEGAPSPAVAPHR